MDKQLKIAIDALNDIAAWDFLPNASQWFSMRKAREALAAIQDEKFTEKGRLLNAPETESRNQSEANAREVERGSQGVGDNRQETRPSQPGEGRGLEELHEAVGPRGAGDGENHSGNAVASKDCANTHQERLLKDERDSWAAKFEHWAKCQESGGTWAIRKADGFRECARALRDNDRWVPQAAKPSETTQTGLQEADMSGFVSTREKAIDLKGDVKCVTTTPLETPTGYQLCDCRGRHEKCLVIGRLGEEVVALKAAPAVEQDEESFNALAIIKTKAQYGLKYPHQRVAVLEEIINKVERTLLDAVTRPVTSEGDK